MRTLVIFRHAKAAPGSSTGRDFDRPLTARGRNDAAVMGKYLAHRQIDQALVSAAVRTRETWEIAAQACDPAPPSEIALDIYLCGAGQLIQRLRALPPPTTNLVVVGHNPCMQEVSLWLSAGEPGRDTQAMRQKFPTAALAIFRLDIESWGALDAGHAKLEHFVTPAELRG